MNIHLNAAEAETKADAPKEFVSIQMVIDHLQLRHDGHEIQKFVMSTQTQIEALCALVNYYDEPQVIASPLGVAALQQMVNATAPIVVYVTRENVQVLMDLNDWAALNERFLTQYLMCDFLAQIVSQSMNESIAQHGSPAKLYVMDLSVEPVASAADAA